MFIIMKISIGSIIRDNETTRPFYYSRHDKRETKLSDKNRDIVNTFEIIF